MSTLALNVQLISDFNADPLGRYLEHDEREPRVSIRATPFGQVWQALAAEEGDPGGKVDAAVIWTRPEGVIEPFARLLRAEPAGEDEILAEVDRFAGAVLAGRRRRRFALVASWTVPDWQRGSGLLDLRPGVGLRHTLLRMNLRLAERLAADPACFVLPAEPWLLAAGRHAYPPKAWLSAKVPFANPVLQAAAADVKAALAATLGRARKLLVLDLDDTLWGGVVGDLGWQRLRLGGHDHLGEAFVAFQQALATLRRRGVQLAIVSKNEEATALEAIDRHPEMVLRRDDFAGWRIGWEDKAKSVAELVGELGLGLDAVVFVDDSRHERERVREALPEVLVPEWPDDPAAYVPALGRLRCFDQPAISDEDRARGAMYAAERARRSARRAAGGTVDDWLASLDLRVVREPLSDANLPRTAQLLNKTNQMNLRTRRLSEPELRAWAAGTGRALWTFRVRDRFGDAGLVGILALERADGVARVVDFVLSCRVMGRKVEETMLHTAVGWARRQGLASVLAEHRPSARNRPCLRFFEASGFTAEGEGRFSWPAERGYELPAAVTLTDADVTDADAAVTGSR